MTHPNAYPASAPALLRTVAFTVLAVVSLSGPALAAADSPPPGPGYGGHLGQGWCERFPQAPGCRDE